MRCVKLRSGAACFGASSFKQNGLTWCTSQRCHSRCKCCAVQLGCAESLAGAHPALHDAGRQTPISPRLGRVDFVVRQALSLRQGRPRQLVRITGPHPPPMGWYGGTVVRPLRHREMSEWLSQPVPVGGYGPVVLAGCWGCPRLRGDACLPMKSSLPSRSMWPLRLDRAWLGAALLGKLASAPCHCHVTHVQPLFGRASAFAKARHLLASALAAVGTFTLRPASFELEAPLRARASKFWCCRLPCQS